MKSVTRDYAELGRKRRARADRRRRYRLEFRAPRRLRGRRQKPDADLQREGPVRPRPRRSPRPATSARRASSARSRRWAASGRSRSILDVKNVRAIATAACRDAADGPDFIARGEKALGTRIQVLSGQQEAELAANGIMMGFRSPDGLAGDLGGGSLELIDVERRRPAPVRHAAARRLAADRRLGRQDRQGARHRRRADRQRRLARQRAATGAFYAVGGTWRAIARLHMEQTDYPLHVMHGYTMPTKEAIDVLRGDPQGQEAVRHAWHRGDLPAAARGAAATAPWCWSACSRSWSRPRCCFSVFGIREGLVYSLLSETRAAQGPAALLLRRLRAPALAVRRACRRAVHLDRRPVRAARARRRREEERRLRHAACLLSDISWRAHPGLPRRAEPDPDRPCRAGRHRPSRAGFFWRLPSTSATWAPAATRTRADGQLSERLKEIVSKKLYRRARIIGAAIRAAHMLSIGRPGIIDETPARLRAGQAGADHARRPMPRSTASACAADSPPWRSCWSGNPKSACKR